MRAVILLRGSGTTCVIFRWCHFGTGLSNPGAIRTISHHVRRLQSGITKRFRQILLNGCLARTVVTVQLNLGDRVAWWPALRTVRYEALLSFLTHPVAA